ncbi:DUF202 domain-containing protein [Entomohabitans teleogrylli]|uniref:DUF202 domain-containing protein n=1 Tax=Entomohabitans teleogrylli TaxID=1384589 RepID=UPI00073D271C|nr:DUF202 domain-containing protein [Entomohabitans teleogrylli]
MADSRKARRMADPGLQPERTALAWWRTLLGYGALLALALRHSWYQAGALFWLSLAIIFLVAGILWYYAHQRNLMNIAISDFAKPQTVRAKLLIALAVLGLGLMFAAAHLRQVILLSGMTL